MENLTRRSDDAGNRGNLNGRPITHQWNEHEEVAR
jgi:hypothetical protein